MKKNTESSRKLVEENFALFLQESIEEKAAQMGRRPAPSGEGLPPKPPAASQSPSRMGNSPARKQPSSPSRKQPSSPARVEQSSPNRPASSPVKVGSATKSLQQRLIEQTQHSKTDKFAEKMRQERMAEVNALNNRYKNGVLKEDLQFSETEVGVQGSHRLEKYWNKEGFLEKYLKIKSALKSSGKSLKGLEKSLNSTILCRTQHC